MCLETKQPRDGRFAGVTSPLEANSRTDIEEPAPWIGMSYWSVGLPQHDQSVGSMEQHTGPAEEMGAKTSLLDGSEGGPVLPSPTLENIKAAYEDQQVEVARELIQQACCVECSAGTPRVPGVNLLCVAIQHGDQQSVQYLLKEARVPVPLDPSNTNPAILAAHCGHATLVKELLDSVPGPCLRMDLLNWMLATSCQQGHMDVVRLLVHSYHANVRDCAIHSDDFAVISGLPLYAAAQAVEPEVIVHSVVPPAGGHPAMLVCSVYDFYPRYIKVSWQRDGEEVSQDVTSTDELADGDWFYQLHSHLEYTPRSGEKISCVVEHASLKTPLVKDWDPSMPESERNQIAIGASGLILGLILSLAGFIYFKRKSRGRILVPNN